MDGLLCFYKVSHSLLVSYLFQFQCQTLPFSPFFFGAAAAHLLKELILDPRVRLYPNSALCFVLYPSCNSQSNQVLSYLFSYRSVFRCGVGIRLLPSTRLLFLHLLESGMYLDWCLSRCVTVWSECCVVFRCCLASHLFYSTLSRLLSGWLVVGWLGLLKCFGVFIVSISLYVLPLFFRRSRIYFGCLLLFCLCWFVMNQCDGGCFGGLCGLLA